MVGSDEMSLGNGLFSGAKMATFQGVYLFLTGIFSLKRNNGTMELQFLMCLGWGWDGSKDPSEGGKVFLTWNICIIWLREDSFSSVSCCSQWSQNLFVHSPAKNQSSLIPKLKPKVTLFFVFF